MAQQPKVFRKSFIDIDSDNVSITVTDAIASDSGQAVVGQLRDRSNKTGWGTTGSTDAASTSLDIDWIDPYEVSHIILVGHNFKSFKLEKWNGSSWVDFSTPVSITNSEDFVTEIEITPESLSRIRLTILGTQVADSDKFLRQIIVTRLIGQFEGWPLARVLSSTSKTAKKTLSGRNFIREQSGHTEIRLDFSTYGFEADLALLESIFFENFSGVLFWANGGDSEQFRLQLVGYRPQDIFLMKAKSEYEPAFEKKMYRNGINMNVHLVEVI